MGGMDLSTKHVEKVEKIISKNHWKIIWEVEKVEKSKKSIFSIFNFFRPSDFKISDFRKFRFLSKIFKNFRPHFFRRRYLERFFIKSFQIFFAMQIDVSSFDCAPFFSGLGQYLNRRFSRKKGIPFFLVCVRFFWASFKGEGASVVQKGRGFERF